MTGLLIMILAPTVLPAQTVLIDAEIRPRTEYRDGYKTVIPTSKDAGLFTSQRTRIGIGYTSGLLNTQITLQDSRIFGQNPSASSDATTGLYEAWGELLVMPGGTLKVGRQTLKFDDNRLFSAPAWSNTGTAHDVALFNYQLNDWKFNLGYALNNNSEISTETLYSNTVKYRSMAVAWLSKEIARGLQASFIFVDEGVQDTIGVGTSYKKWKHNHAYTYGGNITYVSPGSSLNLRGTVYLQSGKNAKGKEMEGMMAAVKANYTVNKTVSVNAGMDWFSGDNKATDAKQSNFKKLYGSDHTFNGYMDYWNTPLDQGLLDYYGGLTTVINSKLNSEAGYHVFACDKPLSSGNKDLGSELDVLLNYKINAQTSIQAGWCCYFKTDNTLFAKQITAGTSTSFPQWAYVMLTIKPTFYKN